MDEVTEASVALLWPDIGALQWNCNHGSMTTCAMNMESYYSILDHQKNLAKVTMPYFPGGTAERQGITSQDPAMQGSLGDFETNHSIVQHHHLEDASRAACLKPELGLENAIVGACAKQAQIDDLIHTLPQGLQDAAHDMLQSFPQGSSKLPKLDRSSSLGRNGIAKPNCQGMACNYESLATQPQSLTHRGGLFPSSLSGPGGLSTKSSHQPGGTLSDVYFGKGPWIDEAQISPSERRFQLSDQVQVRQIGSPAQHSLSQPNNVAVPASGTRPRVRARRGQATDPHSIAERKRREKISNAMKELQELVPTLNKTDKMALVEDVIEYVRFLQLQTKVFIMSRLGSTSAITPLVTETSAEGRSIFEAPTTLQDYTTAGLEEEVAKLMEEDMSAALRLLQGKGMCLMPISLASAIPSKEAKQPD